MLKCLPPLVALALTLPACSGSSNGTPAPASNATDIVINEMSATGHEWLELYNAGDASFDLSGYALADTDKTTGAPRTTKALRFPSGTKVPKRGFVLVLLGKNNSTPGPYSPDACLPEASVGCFYALFSISEARSEAIHLLAPDNKALSSTTYPADLAFDAGSDLTACRIPDGSGGLTACRATPGAPNATR
jgi:hypothetical protein